MQQLLLTLAGLLTALTMAVHSIIGQRRLIGPLLHEGAGVLRHPMARFILPFAWHLTSAIGLVVAAILLAWAWVPGEAQRIGLAMTGIVFTASGIVDAIGSKARHIGWLPLTLIGVLALAATVA